MSRTHRPPGWGRYSLATAVLVLVVAGSARAQATCPPVSLEQCDVPGYLETPCGQLQFSECSGLIQSAWINGYYTLPLERIRRLPESMGGGLAYSRSMPRDTSGDFFYGYGTYADSIEKYQVIGRKNAATLAPDEQWYVQQRADWDANGNAVSSCEELVYEKYQGLSRFEDQIGAFPADYRAIFNNAFAPPAGIGFGTLYGRDGYPIDIAWPSSAPKNEFFTFAPGPYPSGYPSYPFDTSVLAQIAPAGASSAHPSFAYHQQMSQALASYLDDDLEDLADLQDRFADALRRRDQIWSSYLKQMEHPSDPSGGTGSGSGTGTGGSTGGPGGTAGGSSGGTATGITNGTGEQLASSTAMALWEIDSDLDSMLHQAQSRGCLQMEATTPCDWSPRKFHRQLVAATLPQREALYAQCMRFTSNDFSPTSLAKNAISNGVPGALQQDYTGSLMDMNAFFDLLKNAWDTVDPLAKPAYRSYSWTNSRWMGNSNVVSAGYWASAGWGVTDFTGGQQLCNANIYATVALAASMFQVGQFHELLYAYGDARTRANDVHVALNVRIVGNDVYNLDQNVPAQFSITGGPSWKDSVTAVDQTFVVVYVPIHIKIGFSGQAGIKYTLGAGLNRDCAHNRLGATVTGQAEPWINVDGYAYVAAGIQGFQLGLKCNLLLIHAAVPMNASLELWMINPNDQLTLTFTEHTSLDLALEMLSGSLTLYWNFLWWDGDVNIYSWTGFKDTIHLISHDFNVQLAQLR